MQILCLSYKLYDPIPASPDCTIMLLYQITSCTMRDKTTSSCWTVLYLESHVLHSTQQGTTL